MKFFELTLRYLDAAAAEPAGWFLAGEDPEAWLAEMAGWGVPLEQLRLYPVPRSLRDRRPCGLLIPVPTGMSPCTGPRALACRVRARRLFLPANAQLEPDVADAELDESLAGEVAFLHPAAGLVVFEAGDARAAHDLLSAPRRREAAWDAACAGIASPHRLHSIEPEDPPSVEIVLREARDDIGSQQIQGLPLAPKEPGGDAMDQIGRWAGSQLARVGLWFTNLAPPIASQPTWIDHFRDWLKHKREVLRADLDAARNREILRLIYLLEAEPDQGLRFALPLKDMGSRGVASPSDKLPPRNVDFNSARLRGGGAGDAWNLPFQVHQELRLRYHQLANREIRLGRHRRAAYILAELLGDFLSAAAALMQGRHFREAAVLYRDHLKRPLEAARCLEQGGLLMEAVALYDSIGHFEVAGDLLARMERREEAGRAWRKAAEQHREAGEILAASRLYETKVEAPDEALALLAAAWPRAEQAAPSLRERFALLGRLARHEDARRLVAQLRRDPLPPGLTIALAQTLSGIAGSYPDGDLRSCAADATRVVAGRRLPQATLNETTELVQSIARLAPEDRLLARDGHRFVARRKAQLAARVEPPAGHGDPVLVRTFHLPRDVTWKAAAAQGRVFYAAGISNQGIVVVRGLWDGTLQRLAWKISAPASAKLFLQPGSISTHPTLLLAVGVPRLEMLRFEATESLPIMTRVGTPPGMPDRALALAYGEHSTVWVVHEEERRLVLSARNLDGSLVSTHALPAADAPDAPAATPGSPPMLTRRDSVYVALGNRVTALMRGENFQSCELADQVIDLSGSDPLSRPRLAATFEWGGMVLWAGPDWGNVRPFGERLYRPLATFTKDGSLVAIAQGEGQIYGTHNLAITHRRTFPCPENVPLAVVPAAGLSEFAVFGADGTVRLYRVQE